MSRLFLLVFLVVITHAREYKDGYKYVAEINGWLKLHRAPTDWFTARSTCQLEGGHLAFPFDQRILTAMVVNSEQLKGDRCGIFIGIHALFSEGDYTSIDGTPLWKIPVYFKDPQTCPRKMTHPCTVLLPSGFIDTVDCKLRYPFMCYRKGEKEIINTFECETVDSEYKFYTATKNCYKFHLQPRTWQDAYKVCLAEGGHLAILNSVKEVEVISNIFEQYPTQTMLSKYKDHMLVGFMKLNSTWITIHGQSLKEAGYANWAPGEPSNSEHPTHPGRLDSFGNNEGCGSMTRSGLLNNIWCDVALAFVCERHLNENEGVI